MSIRKTGEGKIIREEDQLRKHAAASGPMTSKDAEELEEEDRDS